MMASWESLGGGFNSGFGVSSWAPGRLDVFGQGLDAACWHTAWQGSAWSGWESLGGGFTSEIDAVSWDTNRIDVFGRGTDNACWHRWWDGASWSDWESLGGGFNSGISAASWAPGRLDLFGQGTDGACWHKWFDGGWSDWESLGGGFTSEIDAVSWDTNRIDVFGRGTDNACWHKWFDNGWSDWESLGGGFNSGIAASSWAPGRLDLFGQGTDGACWHKWFEGGWNGWESLGGVFTSGLAAVSWDVGRIDVFGRGTDNACWHTWYANAWADWSTPVGDTVQIPIPDVVNLEAVSVPTFDAATGAELEGLPLGDVAAIDGAHWRTLAGWLEVPVDGQRAGVVCRRTGLNIRLDANGKAASLLPLTDNSPVVTVTYAAATGSGRETKTVAVQSVIDVATGTLMLASPFLKLEDYQNMVKALSDPDSGIKVVVDYGHRVFVQEPAPPPPPTPDLPVFDVPVFVPPVIETPPILPPRRQPPIEVAERQERLRDALRDRIDRRINPRNLQQPLMAVPQGLIGAVEPRVESLARLERFAPGELQMLRNPVLVNKLRLLSRDRGRIVIAPPPPPPGQPATSEKTLVSRFEFPIFRVFSDVEVFPDEPRAGQSAAEKAGWKQVPGRDPSKPLLQFVAGTQGDTFCILPTAYRLGFYRGGNADGSQDRRPIVISQYSDPATQTLRVKVRLSALPYINDDDRAAIENHIRSAVVPHANHVFLEYRGGLEGKFESEWSAGTKDEQQFLPANINLVDVHSAAHRLAFTFDMEALYFDIFCALLKKGLRGNLKVSETGFAASINVTLRLDKMTTNELPYELIGGSASDLAEAAEVEAERTVKVRNTWDYPVRLSRLRVTCLDTGLPGTDPTLAEAEALDVLTEEKVLSSAKDKKNSLAFAVKPQQIPMWTQVTVTQGATAIDGGDPQTWLDRVIKEASLERESHVVKVLAVPMSQPKVSLVHLTLYSDPTSKKIVQELNVVPGTQTDLAVNVSLADLVSSNGTQRTYVVEYECLYDSDNPDQVPSSLPQRVTLAPTDKSLVLATFADVPGAVFKIAHHLPGGDETENDKLSRDAALDVINQARTRGEVWTIVATKPKP